MNSDLTLYFTNIKPCSRYVFQREEKPRLNDGELCASLRVSSCLFFLTLAIFPQLCFCVVVLCVHCLLVSYSTIPRYSPGGNRIPWKLIWLGKGWKLESKTRMDVHTLQCRVLVPSDCKHLFLWVSRFLHLPCKGPYTQYVNPEEESGQYKHFILDSGTRSPSKRSIAPVIPRGKSEKRNGIFQRMVWPV